MVADEFVIEVVVTVGLTQEGVSVRDEKVQKVEGLRGGGEGETIM